MRFTSLLLVAAAAAAALINNPAFVIVDAADVAIPARQMSYVNGVAIQLTDERNEWGDPQMDGSRVETIRGKRQLHVSVFTQLWPAVPAGTNEDDVWPEEPDMVGSVLMFHDCPVDRSERVFLKQDVNLGIIPDYDFSAPCRRDDRDPSRFLGMVSSNGKAVKELTLTFDSTKLSDGLHTLKFVAVADAKPPYMFRRAHVAKPELDVTVHVNNKGPETLKRVISPQVVACEKHCGNEMWRHNFRPCLDGCHSQENAVDFSACLEPEHEHSRGDQTAQNMGCAYMYGMVRGGKSSRASCRSVCSRAAREANQSTLFKQVCMAACETKMKDGYTHCTAGVMEPGICQKKLEHDRMSPSTDACLTGCSIGSALVTEKKGFDDNAGDDWTPVIVVEEPTDFDFGRRR